MAFTRDDWNLIIEQVNLLAESPPPGCTAKSRLELVGPNHIWTQDDVQQVRDKLTELCADHAFSADLKLWRQSIIDEINTAIVSGWCDCECAIACEFGQSGQQFDIGWSADSFPPFPPGSYYHFGRVIDGMQVASPGYTGRRWFATRYNPFLNIHEATAKMFPNGRSGIIDCDGKIVAQQIDEFSYRAFGAPDGTAIVVIHMDCTTFRPLVVGGPPMFIQDCCSTDDGNEEEPPAVGG